MDDAKQQTADSGAPDTPIAPDVPTVVANVDSEATELALERARAMALSGEVNELRKLIQAEHDARTRTEAELNARLNQVRSLVSSTSWKLTSPLRHAVSFLRTGKMAPTGAAMIAQLNELLTAQRPEAGGRPAPSTRSAQPVYDLPNAHSRVRHAKLRLLEHGFRDRAIADLQAMAADNENAFLRGLASWELAQWHANNATPEDAKLSLAYLDQVSPSGLPEINAQRIVVLRAESLALLGQVDEARAALEFELAHIDDLNLHLGLARLEPDLEDKARWINAALSLRAIAPVDFSADGATAYDRLHAQAEPEAECPLKVSVIIPAYNAESMLGTAIRSLLNQTWTNLEILVSDDCSTDGTAALVERFAAEDPRVRLIRGEANSGPYVARNLAMSQATGYFVTCNDSDDWSHPEKIARQVRHLLANPDIVANTSQQARAREDMRFSRRGLPGLYIQPNMSSLMFRRELVVGRIGYWDNVRFAADSEFTKRLKQAFGKEALVDLDTGPLSFQRQTETSLTGSREFGYHGFKMGARLTYEHNHRRFHKANKVPYIGFPATERPFVAPEPMWPQREVNAEGRRHFDVVLASDFRLPGGTSMSNLEEIRAQRSFGIRTGLVQMSLYDLNPGRMMHERITNEIDGDSVELLVHGEHVTCDLLIVRLPWVLQDWQEYLPKIEAKTVKVIVNQPPKRDYAPGSENLYDLPRCLDHLKAHFGEAGSWHPIGPLVREALHTHHAHELEGINLGEDWPNIIQIDDWHRVVRPRRQGRIRICRHSRDQYVKWPATRDDLLKVYPDDPRFEIHVLGGADTPRDVLGGALPDNWRVTEFGKASPRRFLSQYDVFVYYTHPDWVESFGRVIFEAMAVGLPVILPPVYEPVFQDAAIYAEPDDVIARIDALMADDALYEAQVARALDHVRQRFGYEVHKARIAPYLSRSIDDGQAAAWIGEIEQTVSADPAAISGFSSEGLEAVRHGLAAKSRSAQMLLARRLISDADDAMERGPYSVVDKTGVPPSNDRHDYWNPDPFWHANPDTFNGLPFVYRDGERLPGTRMYEPGSERYDRTRLQMLFDDSTILALAWRLTGKEAYAVRAAAHLRHFFLDPATAMRPHLKYAQVRPGHDGNRGAHTGVIEMQGIYAYLDAVRLMTEAGALSEADIAGFDIWLRDYASWLTRSAQGEGARAADDHHGIHYDLQALAIGLHLKERALVVRSIGDAARRIATHFAQDGSQPAALGNGLSLDKACLNYQGWLYLAQIAGRLRVDLWHQQTPDGRSLQQGADWLLSHAGQAAGGEFDADRFIPLWHGLPEDIRPPRPGCVPASPFAVKPRFHPEDGIRPYWNLG